jgi:hypothetical protein
LKEELIRICQLKTAYLVPKVLPTAGVIWNKLHGSLKLLNFCPTLYILMLLAGVLTTCCIIRKFLAKQWIRRLEFITNLMHNFIYSIIILHHDPQHVSSIAVLIFRRTNVYLQYLVSFHSVCCHTERDDTRYCKYKIVLLKMSTAMLETC